MAASDGLPKEKSERQKHGGEKVLAGNVAA